jgi:hypothetical protein
MARVSVARRNPKEAVGKALACGQPADPGALGRVGDAAVLNLQQTNPQETEMAAVLREYRTESGRTLLSLLDESPILLIFLRHFDALFAGRRWRMFPGFVGEIEGRGIRPVIVHLGTPERSKP